MGTMRVNQTPLGGTRANARADCLKARAYLALSQSHVLRNQLSALIRESRHLHSQFRQEIDELRLERMKEEILMSEIQIHFVEGSALYSVLAVPCGESKPRPYGLPVQ